MTITILDDKIDIVRTHIDLDRLRIEIRALNRTKSLYKVLKEELTKLDYWKNRKRGKPRYFKDRIK